MQMDVMWVIFLFALGACIGSFLNVVIYRMPRGQSIVFPASHCPTCGRAIQWYDNIPLLSWMRLKGKCRFCKASISPRYLLVEATTAILVGGLFVCYYLLDIRDGAGTLSQSWPMFAAHAVLLCALFACAIIDIEHWIVPLEVCWFASLVGIASATAAPHGWMPPVSPSIGAMSLGAVAGLGISLLLMRYGLIQQSFLDADETAVNADNEKHGKKSKKGKNRKSVAITKDHGVNPRTEVLRELIFLAPPIAGALTAYLLVTRVEAIEKAWSFLTASAMHEKWSYASYLNGLLSGLFGYLLGGALVWGMRILGTLGFGKEAMGMGDVHILAAVGAVCGWIVPSIAFFVAPFFGLIWAIYLLLGRNQRELPYGPWLAAASLAVMLFYDGFRELLRPYGVALGLFAR